MNDYNLALRTKHFALQVIRLFSRLPKTTEAQVIGKQLLRSGTSVGANYCEAQRGRSRAEWSEWDKRHRRHSRDGSGSESGDERINSPLNAAIVCAKSKKPGIGSSYSRNPMRFGAKVCRQLPKSAPN